MKYAIIFGFAGAMVGTAAMAQDAFDGIGRSVDSGKNGAFSSVRTGDFVTKGNVVIGDGIRASSNGNGGINASDKSVVSTFQVNTSIDGTRVDLPNGGS